MAGVAPAGGTSRRPASNSHEAQGAGKRTLTEPSARDRLADEGEADRLAETKETTRGTSPPRQFTTRLVMMARAGYGLEPSRGGVVLVVVAPLLPLDPHLLLILFEPSRSQRGVVLLPTHPAQQNGAGAKEVVEPESSAAASRSIPCASIREVERQQEGAWTVAAKGRTGCGTAWQW